MPANILRKIPRSKLSNESPSPPEGTFVAFAKLANIICGHKLINPEQDLADVAMRLGFELLALHVVEE